MKHSAWLVKQEPEAYSWETFVNDGNASWTGVRNFQARNNLRAMKPGDWVCYYHSVTDKQIVGIARVEKTAYPDATAKEGDWSAVDLVPVIPLKTRISLEMVKGDDVLSGMALVKQTRLSVTPLTDVQFTRILELGGLSRANLIKAPRAL